MGLFTPPSPGSLLKAAGTIKAIEPPKKKEPGASKPVREKESGKAKENGKKPPADPADETPAD